MYKKVSGEIMKAGMIGGGKAQKAIMAWFLLCCMVIFSATAVFAASNSVIPDTGQILCYDASGAITCPTLGQSFYGQDANYNPPLLQPSYTANGGMVTDTVTGLVWRQQQLADTTYNWYEASGTTDITYNPDPAVNVCGSLTLGSLTWRLPSIKELNQIAHYGRSNPAINAIFINTKYDGSGYWSATESGLVQSNAMDIYFDDAGTRIDGRDKASEANYVICVSGTELTLPDDDDRYADNGTTVSDNMTGLMWQQTDDNVQRTWGNSISICEGLTLQGYTDWRLPNIKELQTIVDYSTYNPAVNTTYFPGTNSVPYWSSTTDDAFPDSAWSLDFSDGYVTSIGKTIATTSYTRCVRENQVDATGPAAIIDSGPTQPTTTSSSAIFTFHAEDAITGDPEITATLKCKLDNTGPYSTYATCTSPKTYTGLGTGSHTFYVKATDAALNTGTPASYSWTIDLKPDLVVTALTVPSTGGAGAAMSVTDTTKNSGANPSVASTTSFYLSLDNALDGGDTQIGTRAVPALAAGISNSATTASLTIPLATPDGLYYIIAKADGPGLITETNETNNTRTSVAQINIGADLTVSALTATVDMVAGTISVTDTTQNNGTGVGTSKTKFYLSTDTVIGGDTVIGDRDVPALTVGASDTATTSFAIPAGKAGTFYIIAKADGTDSITETNEANNTKASALIKIGGDLTITVLTVPATGVAGAAIDVTDTTKNSTLGTAVGASKTRFYLSTDTVIGGDTVLGDRDVPALAPGAIDTATTSLTIPTGKAGTFYIIAKADAVAPLNTETNEANNAKVSAVIKIGGDLTVSVITVPATGVAGAAIDITDTTKNSTLGTIVGASKTRFYLSTDTVIGGDTVLGERDVPSLAPGESDTAITSLTIPADKAGIFYIIAKADATNLIAETNETNNAKASTLIKIGGDLTVSALTAPATGVAGAAISITDTTKNSTSGTGVGASTTSFYLSSDAVLDGGDVSLGSRSVPALAVGAISTATTASLTIPLGTPAGSYYIIAKADDPDLITETNETNNTKASAAIKIGGDLTVTVLTVPATGAAGAAISVTFNNKNIGNDTVAASKTRFYLSTDTVLNIGVDPVLGNRDVGVLAAGLSIQATTSMTIPTGTAAGTYYIIAKADGANLISEVNETNNTKVSAAIKIGPDLIVSTLTAPATVVAGASIDVTDTTKNNGAARADASTTSFYLSRKTVLGDSSQISLGSRAVPSLAAGVSSTATTASLTIPLGTGTGTWYIIGQADSGDLVAEANEINNTMFKSITVQ